MGLRKESHRKGFHVFLRLGEPGVGGWRGVLFGWGERGGGGGGGGDEEEARNN